jgi:cell division transport system ATP-binding protein
MIRFQKVSKHYGNQTALRDITFSIEKGDMAFITGPSGSGKTTLLKLIYLAEKPDEGTISIGEQETGKIRESDIPTVRRNMGFVFQDFRLLDNRNVFDNVALALRIRGVDEKEVKTRVFESLKSVNLRHKTDSHPAALSGGEQQRVVIARAIVSEGTTILIATHNRELFRNTGRMVLRLDNGNLVGEERG